MAGAVFCPVCGEMTSDGCEAVDANGEGLGYENYTPCRCEPATLEVDMRPAADVVAAINEAIANAGDGSLELPEGPTVAEIVLEGQREFIEALERSQARIAEAIAPLAEALAGLAGSIGTLAEVIENQRAEERTPAIGFQIWTESDFEE